MKFICPKCRTRYAVADDRVPSGKTFRFSCKKCSNVIRLRRKMTQAARPSVLAQRRPEDASTEAEAEGIGSTLVATDSEVDAVRRASAEGEPFGLPPDAQDSSEDWFVLKKREQLGPIPPHRLREMLAKGEIAPRTYVWRDGMTSWQRLRELPSFREAVSFVGGTAQMGFRRVARAPESDPSESPSSSSDGDSEPVDVRLGSASAVDQPQAMEPQRSSMGAPVVAAALEVLGGSCERRSPASDGDGCVAHRSPGVEHDSVSRLALAARRSPSEAHNSRGAPLAGGPAGDILAREEEERGSKESLLDIESGVFEPLVRVPVDSDRSNGDSGASDARAEKAQRDPGDAYFEATPGETTRVFMATAGLFKRRRRNRIAAAVGTAVTICAVGSVALDILGVIQIPGMGMVYDFSGLSDPNVARAIERTEGKLNDANVDDEEKARLRNKLLGLRSRPRIKRNRRRASATPGAGTDMASRSADGKTNGAPVTRGIAEAAARSAQERDLIADVFGDTRKKETSIKVADIAEIRTPNLPGGLTQESIFEVIEENRRSMSLCIAEARRKGERLDGRMEVQITIEATGRVIAAEINTPQFLGSAIGTCTVRRVRGWRFPRFNGKPITVIFPYVLSTAW